LGSVAAQADAPEYLWSSVDCQLQAQVDSDGLVRLVHDPTSSHTNSNSRMYMQSNVWTFKVNWGDTGYPLASNSCDGACTLVDDMCLCDVSSVDTVAVFTATPTLAEVTSELYIGSAAPEDYGAGVYTLTDSTSDVEVYTKGGAVDIETIYKATVGGAVAYFRNKKSTVNIGGGYSFRNVPNFNVFPGSNRRDAEYEIDALLDHLFRHQNTAPFYAHNLIQRFTTSNPSPRYIEAAAAAFTSGAYGGHTYSGEYGDLGAMIAAIVLDREARSTTLDADPTHGSLREPIVKLIHFMRAMEYEPNGSTEARFGSSALVQLIGQDPFAVPSVFNFYYPDFQPTGAIAMAGLVASEAQLSVPHFMLAWLDAMVSLVNHGLQNCDYGMGESWGATGSDMTFTADTVRTFCRLGQYPYTEHLYWDYADGHLAFTPTAVNDGSTAEAIVDELDLLLTSGRLSDTARSVIIDAYNQAFTDSVRWTSINSAERDEAKAVVDALKMAQSLFLITAEFHATNNIALTTTLRPTPTASTASGLDFKVVIVLWMNGGADSFNILVPHSGCNADTYSGNDMFSEYTTVRGADIALSQASLLPISVPAGTQPCTTFGIHPSLPVMQTLYNDGDGAFVANMGALIEPLTAADLGSQGTKQIPPAVFSHNSQTEQAMTVYSQDAKAADGVLGRIIDALSTQAAPYKSAAYSLSIGVPDMLKGSQKVEVITDTQFSKVNEAPYDSAIPALIEKQSTSLFAETYMDRLQSALRSTEEFPIAMNAVPITQTFPFNTAAEERIARLIGANNQLDQVERGAYFYQVAGFDTHASVMNTDLLDQINGGLDAMIDELKALGMWDNTVVVQLSEFGRTMTSNGRGTDHGWGGNYFVAGGAVNGGQIFGNFPSSFAELVKDGGRGHVLPTLGWEALWYGIAQWLGVDDDSMATVLPNAANFDSSTLLSAAQIFSS